MSNILFQTLTAQGEKKRSPSNTLVPDFSALNLGADAMSITQVGSGASAYFDFGARALRTSYAALNPNDLITKSYADNIASGLIVKDACRVATTAALPPYNAAGAGGGKTLTGTINSALVVDGISLIAGNRILVKDELGSEVHNGVYVVTGAGSPSSVFILTRATDFDGSPANEVKGGSFTFVQEGTINADSGWVVVTDSTIVVDTSGIEFTQFSGAGQITAGAAMTKSGNTLNVIYDNATIGVNGLDELEVIGLSIGTAQLSDDGVNEDKINTSVAGNGLTGGGGVALSVDPGEGIRVSSGLTEADFSQPLTNANASAIIQNKIVYIKADGSVDLASKSILSNAFELGAVEDTSIASATIGNIIVRRGAVLRGLSGLIPGRLYHVDSAGNMALYGNITYSVGEAVYIVGRAMSATALLFNPMFDFEY